MSHPEKAEQKHVRVNATAEWVPLTAETVQSAKFHGFKTLLNYKFIIVTPLNKTSENLFLRNVEKNLYVLFLTCFY